MSPDDRDGIYTALRQACDRAGAAKHDWSRAFECSAPTTDDLRRLLQPTAEAAALLLAVHVQLLAEDATSPRGLDQEEFLSGLSIALGSLRGRVHAVDQAFERYRVDGDSGKLFGSAVGQLVLAQAETAAAVRVIELNVPGDEIAVHVDFASGPSCDAEGGGP